MKDETTSIDIFSTQSLVTMAMFAAVLCVSAYLSIPLPNGTHITLLNFITTLIVLVFPLGQAVLIILAWLLLGCVGVPVFAGGSAGIGYLVSPIGGYNIAFLVTAILVPLLCGKKYNRIRTTAAALFSVILVDLMGTLQMMILSDMTFLKAFIAGFLPFIVLDIVKAVTAAQLVPVFRQILSSERPAGIPKRLKHD